MMQLGLHMVGLPSARLPDQFSVPTTSGIQVYARGGPSYASTAVVWRAQLSSVLSPLRAIGSSR
eukprot:207611-Karenia_brevis.AAC.1